MSHLKKVLKDSFRELHDDGRKTYPFIVEDMEVSSGIGLGLVMIASSFLLFMTHTCNLCM